MLMFRALAAVLTAATVLAVPASASAGPPPIDWQPCRTSAPPGAECAFLDLPVDWSRPDGETFRFAIARRAADPATRVGTLIFGPGGPGDSGTKRIMTGSKRFSEELQRRFDIASFDPRGVGGSAPVRCDLPAVTDPVIDGPAAFAERIATNRAYWASCRTDPPSLISHAGTADTVRDLDALRAALGERQVTFHGSSYGTLLGELYAERYPSHVRALVLESAMDHSQDVGGFLRTQGWALQDSFDAFVTWCEQAGDACAVHDPGARQVWHELVRDAGRGGTGLSVWQLHALLHALLYGPKYTDLAAALADLRDGEPVLPVAVPTPVVPVFCADWSLTVRDYDEYARLVRRAETRDLRYSAGALAVALCLGWEQPVTSPQHRLRVHTPVPVLQINARHDPATGYNWALSVARQLGRSGVLLTYAGAGHGSYGSSDCMRTAVDAYLIGLTVPREGGVCPVTVPAG
ncbi:alpha/beta hydrolase [Pseudosporangium ferrugineum]|uniref:Alpha/beta hydrolase family protein n=1 Tax=Pseudosporangium ferrugineum TaxID=439699 RepID=A0A2T0SIQ0_9ACTN|nr:alpha/beta hydrolase [Pseudosporangium ferrugineum]PRY33282.1 alpha/beta hydrolase family protein [Pseudosporangium ferrugineum]